MSYFDKVSINDSDGNAINPSKEEEQLNSQDLLEDIIKELKIMNLHLALITNTHITKTEVE